MLWNGMRLYGIATADADAAAVAAFSNSLYNQFWWDFRHERETSNGWKMRNFIVDINVEVYRNWDRELAVSITVPVAIAVAITARVFVIIHSMLQVVEHSRAVIHLFEWIGKRLELDCTW